MVLPVLFAVSCLGLARRMFGSGWTSNMQVWFLFLFFVMDFIGMHILWMVDGDPCNPVLIWVLYLLPVCLLAANLLMVRHPPAARGAAVPPADLEPGSGPVLLMLGSLSLVFLAIYIRNVPHVPLLVALSGADEVADSRAESTLWQAGTLFKYVWLVVVRYLLPLVAIACFVRARLTRRVLHRTAVWFLLPVTYVTLMIDAQKAQVIFFTVQLLVASLLMKHRLGLPSPKQPRTGRRFAIGIASVLLGLECLAIMYYGFMVHSHEPGESFWHANGFILEAIFRRTFISQARPLNVIFNAFPDHHAFLMGRTFPLSEWMGLGPRFDLSMFAFEQIFGFAKGGASCLFVAEFYADFGPWAAVASIVLFAIGFVAIERRLRDQLTRPKAIIAYAFLTGYVMRLAVTQVIMGLGLPLVGLLLYRLIGRVIRRQVKSPPAIAVPTPDGG